MTARNRLLNASPARSSTLRKRDRAERIEKGRREELYHWPRRRIPSDRRHAGRIEVLHPTKGWQLLPR